MIKILLLFTFLPLTIFAQLQVTAPVRYLALGDSYTIGQSIPADQSWPNQLRDSLAVRGITTDTLRIIATTGWRTDDLINAITGQGLDSGHFNLVSLLIGVNNQYQGRPISQYITQFPQLIDSAIRYAGGDTSHVFIVSIPDYAYTPFGVQNTDTAMVSMQIDTYNLIGRQFADSFHIKYFNITPISRMGLANPALVNTNDGLHPSGLQYSMWISLILQTIDSARADTTVINTGITSLAGVNRVLLYPNPTTGIVNLSFDKLPQQAALHIYNLLGEEVMAKSLIENNATLDLSSLSSGLYTLHIISPSYSAVIRLLKE